MTIQQKRTARKFINLAERGNPKNAGYPNTENDDDGRGETLGIDGFTTANGDALEVILEYQKAHPQNRLTKFIPELERLAKEESDDLSHLDGFAAAWRFEAQNESFRAAQDVIDGREYFNPAMALAKQYGYDDSALGEAIADDIAIVCGGGDDHDSLGKILERVELNLRSAADDKTTRIQALLDEYRRTLEDPEDKSTADAWREALSRVDVWEELLHARNFDLVLPVTIHTSDYAGTVIE